MQLTPLHSILAILVVGAFLTSCSSTATKKSESPKDDISYYFDYQLQPASTYAYKFHHYTNDDLVVGVEMSITTLPLNEPTIMLNDTGLAAEKLSGEESQKINFKITTDKYTPLNIKNLDNASKKILDSQLPKAAESESIQLIGHSIDRKNLEITEVINKSNFGNNRVKQLQDMAKMIWETQNNYPVGHMMIGDTFFVDKKFRRSINDEFYILDKVKDDNAYFRIEKHNGALVSKKGKEQKGRLEYNLKNKIYQYHELTIISALDEVVSKRIIEKVK